MKKIYKFYFLIVFLAAFAILSLQEGSFKGADNVASLLSFANVVAVQADSPSDYVNVGGKVWCTLPDGAKAPVKSVKFFIEGYAGLRMDINEGAKYLRNDQRSNELGRWKTTKIAGFWKILYQPDTSMQYFASNAWQSFSSNPTAALTQCSTSATCRVTDGRGTLPCMIDSGANTCRQSGNCVGTNGQNSFYIGSTCDSNFTGTVYSVCDKAAPAYYCFSQGRGEISYMDFDLGACPAPSSFACTSLTPSTQTYNAGSKVTFSCSSSFSGSYTLKHYNYRIKASTATDWTLPAEWQGIPGLTPQYTIPESGSYTVQCQACRNPVGSETSPVCTAWGQAS